MTEQGPQYDHIGSKYDEYSQTATLRRAEIYTVLRMAGALSGKRVLDMACGFGFFTRLLKQQGAAQVLGIDISPEMVRLGRAQEQTEPHGDRYACDGEFVTELPTPYQCVQWSQEAHEQAIKEAGFRTSAWYPSEVSPEDLARYGESYWQDFYDNCLVIGLVCQK